MFLLPHIIIVFMTQKLKAITNEREIKKKKHDRLPHNLVLSFDVTVTFNDFSFAK